MRSQGIKPHTDDSFTRRMTVIVAITLRVRNTYTSANTELISSSRLRVNIVRSDKNFPHTRARAHLNFYVVNNNNSNITKSRIRNSQ